MRRFLIRIFACRFRQLTGIPCPSCGSTRAVSAMLRLQPRRALRLSPIVVAAMGMLGLRAKNALAGDDDPAPTLELIVVAVFALALLRGVFVAAGRRTWFTSEHLPPKAAG